MNLNKRCHIWGHLPCCAWPIRLQRHQHVSKLDYLTSKSRQIDFPTSNPFQILNLGGKWTGVNLNIIQEQMEAQWWLKGLMGEESCNVGVVGKTNGEGDRVCYWRMKIWDKWKEGQSTVIPTVTILSVQPCLMLQLSCLINKSDITFNNCVRTYVSFHKSNYRSDITRDTDKNIKNEHKSNISKTGLVL